MFDIFDSILCIFMALLADFSLFCQVFLLSSAVGRCLDIQQQWSSFSVSLIWFLTLGPSLSPRSRLMACRPRLQPAASVCAGVPQFWHRYILWKTHNLLKVEAFCLNSPSASLALMLFTAGCYFFQRWLYSNAKIRPPMQFCGKKIGYQWSFEVEN